MKPPVCFVFGSAKENTNDLKKLRMKKSHREGMVVAAQFLTIVIASIEAFFQEVDEDMQMACSVEGQLPCPPHASHLYLKHCDGRELQADAVTPRSSDVDSEDENSSPLAASQSQASGTATGLKSKASFNAKASQAKIERYHVLNKAHAI